MFITFTKEIERRHVIVNKTSKAILSANFFIIMSFLHCNIVLVKVLVSKEM